jgi:hypothetical protein
MFKEQLFALEMRIVSYSGRDLTSPLPIVGIRYLSEPFPHNVPARHVYYKHYFESVREMEHWKWKLKRAAVP